MYFEILYFCRYGTWPLNLPATKDVNLPFYSKNITYNDTSIWKFNAHADNACHQKCPKLECNSILYRTSMGSVTKFSSLENKRSTKFCLLRPENPRLLFRYQPAIDFIEFFTYTASSISIWFGFSALILMQKVILFLRYRKANSKIYTTQNYNYNFIM